MKHSHGFMGFVLGVSKVNKVLCIFFFKDGKGERRWEWRGREEMAEKKRYSHFILIHSKKVSPDHWLAHSLPPSSPSPISLSLSLPFVNSIAQ